MPFQNIRKMVYYIQEVKPMLETEALIRKAQALPNALFKEAEHYIDYLSQKAHTAYVAEKIAEVERDMANLMQNG